MNSETRELLEGAIEGLRSSVRELEERAEEARQHGSIDLMQACQGKAESRRLVADAAQAHLAAPEPAKPLALHGHMAHKAHCYHGEYPGSCKYGDADCPAKPAAPEQPALPPELPEGTPWRISEDWDPRKHSPKLISAVGEANALRAHCLKLHSTPTRIIAEKDAALAAERKARVEAEELWKRNDACRTMEIGALEQDRDDLAAKLKEAEGLLEESRTSNDVYAWRDKRNAFLSRAQPRPAQQRCDGTGEFFTLDSGPSGAPMESRRDCPGCHNCNPEDYCGGTGTLWHLSKDVSSIQGGHWIYNHRTAQWESPCPPSGCKDAACPRKKVGK